MSVGENKKHVHLVWSNMGRKTALSGNEISDSTLETLMQELKVVRQGKKQVGLPWVLEVSFTTLCQRGAPRVAT